MTLKTPDCNVVAKLILATREKAYAGCHARLVNTKDLPALKSTSGSKDVTADNRTHHLKNDPCLERIPSNSRCLID